MGEFIRMRLAQDQRARATQRRYDRCLRTIEQLRRKLGAGAGGKAVDLEQVLDSHERAIKGRPPHECKGFPVQAIAPPGLGKERLNDWLKRLQTVASSVHVLQ